MRMRVFWMAMVAASVASVACQQTPVVPVIEAPPVELRVTISDSVLFLGEVDTINVIIKNTLTVVARLAFPTQCQDRVFIKNLAGAIVLPATGDYVCAPVTSQLSIPPGDSIVRTYYWTGGQSLSPPDPSTKLPPGRYFVSATLQASNYSVSAFPFAIRLSSNLAR
ncbi:MAG: BsuPI-related putative proteinase inhibitor [Gemmatimonadaceae bacterium]